MVEMSQIREVVLRIIELFHPNQVILFGSYACGTPEIDSDVDFLVVMPFQGKPWKPRLFNGLPRPVLNRGRVPQIA